MRYSQQIPLNSLLAYNPQAHPETLTCANRAGPPVHAIAGTEMAAMVALAASSPGKFMAPPRRVVTVSNVRPRDPAVPSTTDPLALPLRAANWPPWPLERAFQSEEAESLGCVVGVLGTAKTPGTAAYPQERLTSEHSSIAVAPSCFFRSALPAGFAMIVVKGFPDASVSCSAVACVAQKYDRSTTHGSITAKRDGHQQQYVQTLRCIFRADQTHIKSLY